MRLLKLAGKNIFRHSVRSIFSIIGIAASVSVLFAILSLTKSFEKRLEKEIQRTTIDFMVVPAGCPHEIASLLFYGKASPVFMDQELVTEIKKTPGIEVASPMIVIQMPHPKKKILLYGYEPAHIDVIKPHWRIKGEMPAGWETLRLNKILIGSDIANAEGLKIGDSITFHPFDKEFLVSGILDQTFSRDDAFIFTDIKLAREVAIKTLKLPVVEVEDPTCSLKHRITEEPVSAVAVKLKEAALLERVKADLRKRLPNIQIVEPSETARSISEIASSAKALSISIVIVALLIGSAGVMNSMLMAVFERTQEIGMIRAIGASKADIFKMIIYEAVITTGIGGIGGIAILLSASPLMENIIGRFIPFIYSKGLITFDPVLAAACIILSLILGVCAGLYPASKASRVSPVEAIRH